MPIEQFAIFFLLLITGYFLKKYNVFTDAAINAINKFIILVGYPCLILARTTALEMDNRIFINFLFSLFIALGIIMLFTVYARVYYRGKRFPGEDKIVSEFAMIGPNNGFMGLPIAVTVFGDLGMLYMIGTNIALNIMFFTYGISSFNHDKSVTGEPFRKKFFAAVRMILHPGIVAAFVGIIICYSGWELPGIARGYLDLSGAIVTPLAMISIGTMLAGGFGIRSFKKRIVVETVLNKLFVIPIFTAIIVWFLPIDPLVKMLLIVSNTMPTATLVGIFSEQYDRDKSLAVEIIVISTLFSMITIPFLVWVLNQMGL